MAKIGLEENKAIAVEVADKAITLVKNTEDIFPISLEKHKRVLLVDVKGTEGGFGALIGAQGPKPSQMMKERLEKEGFEVSIWESPIEKLMELPME
jgi:beta-N-acetylhexosaminidase